MRLRIWDGCYGSGLVDALVFSSEFGLSRLRMRHLGTVVWGAKLKFNAWGVRLRNLEFMVRIQFWDLRFEVRALGVGAGIRIYGIELEVQGMGWKVPALECRFRRSRWVALQVLRDVLHSEYLSWVGVEDAKFSYYKEGQLLTIYPYLDNLSSFTATHSVVSACIDILQNGIRTLPGMQQEILYKPGCCNRSQHVGSYQTC